MKEYEEKREIGSIWSWALMLLLCAFILAWGFMIYALVKDAPARLELRDASRRAEPVHLFDGGGVREGDSAPAGRAAAGSEALKPAPGAVEGRQPK